MEILGLVCIGSASSFRTILRGKDAHLNTNIHGCWLGPRSCRNHGLRNAGFYRRHFDKEPEFYGDLGWSGGAKVLGNLPVPGRPTNLDYSTARACCACSRSGWGWFGHFFSHLSFLSSFSLSLGDGPVWTEILSQRAVGPKTTNQPILCTGRI